PHDGDPGWRTKGSARHRAKLYPDVRTIKRFVGPCARGSDCMPSSAAQTEHLQGVVDTALVGFDRVHGVGRPLLDGLLQDEQRSDLQALELLREADVVDVTGTEGLGPDS